MSTGKESELKLYNSHSEAAILGAIIKNNKLFYTSQNSLNESYFYGHVHRKIYNTIKHLINNEDNFDKDVLKAKLQSLNILDDIGGVEYIDEVYSSACWDKALPQHCNIIKELFIKRESLIAVENYQKILSNPHNEDSPQSLAVDIISNINSILTINSENAGLMETADCLKELFEGETGRKLKIGIEDIDNYYPIKTKELIILGGRPSHGKSALACTIAEGAARHGNRVDFYALEMSKEQIMARLLSSSLFGGGVEIPYFDIVDREKRAKFTDYQWQAINEFKKRIPNIAINDGSSQTVSDVISGTLSSSKIKDTPDLIIVDYLDVMSFSDFNNTERRDIILGAVANRLRDFAKDHDCCVILLVQLNREVEKTVSGRPNSSFLRNSGELEQIADKIMFSFKKSKHLKKMKGVDEMTPEEYDEYIEWEKKIEVIIDKQRMGQTGSVILNCNIKCNFITDREIKTY